MKFKTSFGQPVEITETPEGLVTQRLRIERNIKDGESRSSYWFRNGEVYLTVSYHRDGSLSEEYWVRDGKVHRDNGPVDIYYFEGKVFPGDTRTFEQLERDGAVKLAEWKRDGKRHRSDGPAYISYYRGGSIMQESWLRDGKAHRDNGPASTRYDFDGSIHAESWYQDGKYHRDDGPAFILYHEGIFPGDNRTFEELEKAGSVKLAMWYRNGEEVIRFT